RSGPGEQESCSSGEIGGGSFGVASRGQQRFEQRDQKMAGRKDPASRQRQLSRLVKDVSGFGRQPVEQFLFRHSIVQAFVTSLVKAYLLKDEGSTGEGRGDAGRRDAGRREGGKGRMGEGKERRG